MSVDTAETRSAGVKFPPPVLFILSSCCGSAIEAQIPLPLSTVVVLPAQILLGQCAIALGAVLLTWALMTFVLTKTAIYPTRPARQLVAHGPYQFSRNPMYVALTAITVGVSLLADNLWMVMLLPVVLVVLTKFVIQREERYLAEIFGEAYHSYQARVRRWL